MKLDAPFIASCLFSGAVALAPLYGLAHGDVTPHAVDTQSLPSLGDQWRTENPYRGLPEAVKVGASAYTQNCARCHGLEAVSGGMSPDLRLLDADCTVLKDDAKKQACYKEVDTYFVTAVQQGELRNGTVYMPPFEKVFNQEAIWAIKAYLETRRDTN
jgi:cytochrome c-550 PedF